MKAINLIIIVLVLSMSASAALYQRGFAEDINPAEHDLAMCERHKQLGAVSIHDKRICCVNKDKNRFCGNDEPVLGKCDANLCILPTKTFRESWTYWTRPTPCFGLAILTGEEFAPLMESQQCEKEGQYWCCNPYAFPPPTEVLQPEPGMQPPPPESPTGALLIVNKQKWRALELGYRVRDNYAHRAYEHEKKRCSAGGKSIEIINPEYGSYFADSRNRHEGERAFYMKPGEVIPLVTWC